MTTDIVTSDLALLHAVIAYARANGWTHDSTRFDNSPLEHRWMRGDVKVSVWGGVVYVNDLEFRPASVRQAVDVLVALGVLPVEFSSAYAAGQQLGDVAKCPQCGKQARSYSRGCSECGYGKPAAGADDSNGEITGGGR